MLILRRERLQQAISQLLSSIASSHNITDEMQAAMAQVEYLASTRLMHSCRSDAERGGGGGDPGASFAGDGNDHRGVSEAPISSVGVQTDEIAANTSHSDPSQQQHQGQEGRSRYGQYSQFEGMHVWDESSSLALFGGDDARAAIAELTRENESLTRRAQAQVRWRYLGGRGGPTCVGGLFAGWHFLFASFCFGISDNAE